MTESLPCGQLFAVVRNEWATRARELYLGLHAGRKKLDPRVFALAAVTSLKRPVSRRDSRLREAPELQSSDHVPRARLGIVFVSFFGRWEGL